MHIHTYKRTYQEYFLFQGLTKTLRFLIKVDAVRIRIFELFTTFKPMLQMYRRLCNKILKCVNKYATKTSFLVWILKADPLSYNVFTPFPRNSSCGKVMFSQASASLSVYSGVGTHRPGVGTHRTWNTIGYG